MTKRQADIALSPRLTAYVTREEGAAELRFRPRLGTSWSIVAFYPSSVHRHGTILRWRWEDVDSRLRNDDADTPEPYFRGLGNGRPRTANVMLPPDVQRVIKPSGRAYYYYAPARGSAAAGKRVPLGSDTADPEFWRMLREAQSPSAIRDGTLSKLIAEYRAHKAWADLRPESKRVYAHFFDRLEASGGDRPVAAMTRRDIYALLDQMSGTPVAANLMLTVFRTLLEFGVPRGYRDDNPAIGVKKLKIEDSGHSPWPEHGYAYVMQHAPAHLRRLAFLGRATGQRISDLVKMRPADLVDDGINVRIGKLRDRPHFVPLTAAQMTEIRSWGVRDLEFFISG